MNRFKDNDDQFDAQATALITYFQANQSRLGLTSTQITDLQDNVTAFTSALLNAQATQSAARQAMATKDAAKASSTSALSLTIDNLGTLFTNADRVANGIPPLTGPSGPRPVPTEVPSLVISNGAPGDLLIKILNAANTTHRGKPADVDDVELRWELDDGTIPDDYDDWHPGPTPSDVRSPTVLHFKPAYTGKTILLVARYRNTNGNGPWGQQASAVVA